MKVHGKVVVVLAILGCISFACLAADEKKDPKQEPAAKTVQTQVAIEYPYEVKTVERGDKQIGENKGWHNTLIVKVNKLTGETWILTHIGDGLKWVSVPESSKKE